MADFPKIFNDYLTGKPFEVCKVCEIPLLDPARPYMIEKAFKRHNMLEEDTIVFEIAICLDCAQEMRNELSEMSRKKIEAYMAERMNQARLMDPDRSMFEKCLISNIDLKEEDEYHIYGHFFGEELIETPLPYALSGKIIEEIADMLSDETQGFLDDFMGDHFGVPPAYESSRKLIFV